MQDNKHPEDLKNTFKHDLECVSPGMYDDLFKCRKCGKTHMQSIDNPASKRPELGCNIN